MRINKKRKSNMVELTAFIVVSVRTYWRIVSSAIPWDAITEFTSATILSIIVANKKQL